MPNIISTSNALAQIKDLIKLLKNHKPHHSLAYHNNDSLSALNILTDIFKLNPSKKATLNVSKPYLTKPSRVPIPTNLSSLRVNKTKLSNNNTSTNNNHTQNTSTSIKTTHSYNTCSKANKANSVLNIDTGKLEEYRQLHKGKNKII